MISIDSDFDAAKSFFRDLSAIIYIYNKHLFAAKKIEREIDIAPISIPVLHRTRDFVSMYTLAGNI